MLYNCSAIVYAYVILNRLLMEEGIKFMMMHLVEILWISFILLGKYNHKKSTAHKMMNQWFFYAFYPLHLVVIYIITTILHNFQIYH